MKRVKAGVLHTSGLRTQILYGCGKGFYMPDNTTSRPDFESLNLNPDTAAFSCLTPRAASVAFGVHQAIGVIYHFRPKVQWWSLQILSRQAGEPVGFESIGKQWRILWPHLSDDAVERKVSIYNKWMKDEQQLVGLKYVDVRRQKPDVLPDGSYRAKPTFYGNGDFWNIFDYVQRQYVNVDLLALSRVARLARYVTIIEAWGAERDCKPIVRERKKKEAKDTKEKSAPLPCRCNCDQCQLCAAKNATGSEANGRVDELRHQPNEDFNADLEAFAERYKRELMEKYSLGKKFAYTVKHVMNILEMAENEARETIVQVKTNGGLRLVGGQPK